MLLRGARCGALILAAIFAETPASAGAQPAPACRLNISVEASRDLTTVAGLPRTDVLFLCQRVRPSPLRLNGSAFWRSRDDLYGDCSAPDDGTLCALPLQISTAPSCQGSIDDARRTPTGRRGRMLVRRGVRVLVSEGGRTMHVATGRVTIVIFADTAARAREAFRALRGAAADPSGNLPAEVRMAPRRDPLCHPRARRS